MSTSWFGKHNLITTVIVALVFSILGAGGFAFYSQHKSSLKTSNTPTVKGQTTNILSAPLVSTPTTSTLSTPKPTTQTTTQSQAKTNSEVWAERCGEETSVAPPIKYVDASWLLVGETETHLGTDGKQKTCEYPDGHKATYVHPDPLTTWVYVGTKVATPTPAPQPTGITYEWAQSSCGALGTGGTSAFEQCMHAYGY